MIFFGTELKLLYMLVTKLSLFTNNSAPVLIRYARIRSCARARCPTLGVRLSGLLYGFQGSMHFPSLAPHVMGTTTQTSRHSSAPTNRL